jgi:hypothetical protein
MAQSTTIAIPARTWTLITSNDVTALTFVNTGFYQILITPTVGTTPPTSDLDATPYPPGGEINVSLADLSPGIAANRVYAYCSNPTTVRVSHL